MPKEMQPRTAAPTWDSLSPGEKQAWLLGKALDCKRDRIHPERTHDEAHRGSRGLLRDPEIFPDPPADH